MKKKERSGSKRRRKIVNKGKEGPIWFIRTKLHRPQIPHDWVKRPRLLELLGQDIQQGPITIVSAPAGYGKSCLVSDWLEECGRPSGWVSLDERDNDLRVFLTCILIAIQNMFPAVCRETSAVVDVVDMPPFSKLVTSLINELSGIEQPFVLVLDDYHNIQEKLVHDLLKELLRYPLKSMHLVLIGRRAPRLPYATYRAQGRLIEIGASALRFTVHDTETFLQQALRIEVDMPTARAWQEKTEGWVTGLRLATLAVRTQIAKDGVMPAPLENTQFAREYFFNEVFSVQRPEIQQCLLKTAILDRFNAPLCHAVCMSGKRTGSGERRGWDFIAQLKKENLFLIPLDEENNWFRYHHLFQHLLQNQLKRYHSARDIGRYHLRASDWFAEEGLIEEALEHALAGGDIPAAIQLVARYGHQLMNDQQWPRLERWLGMLPPDCIDENPEMLLFGLWLNHMRTAGFDVSALATQLEKIENLISTLPPNGSVNVEHIRSHCDALRSFQHFMRAEGEISLKYAQSACENIPVHHKRARLRAHIFQIGAYQMAGELETGLSTYFREVQENPDLNSGDQAMYLANLCFIYWIDADLVSMLRTCENTLKIAVDHQVSEAIAFSLYFNGIASYHQNNLQSAEENLARMVKDFYMNMQILHGHGSFCLSLIYLAQGQSDKARDRNRKIMQYAGNTGNQLVLRMAEAFEAELALREGRLSEASIWVKRFNPRPFMPPFGFYMPQLTLIKFLLAQDTAKSRHRAADLIDEVYAFLVSTHNKVFEIELLALRALLHDARGNVQAALDTLTEAIECAEPGGFIRHFVDVGPRMAYLLKRLTRQDKSLEYIGRILAAFRDQETGMVQGVTDVQTVRLSSLSSQLLAEPLTSREAEILDLLAKRMRNREIADKLIISNETVKSHLTNLYQKLNVKGRQQAVDKVKALGILSSR